MMPSTNLVAALTSRRAFLLRNQKHAFHTLAEVHRLNDYISRLIAHDNAPMAGMEPVQLERWKINGAKDELCLQYEGSIWEVYQGPQPETDTHPNCKCERIPFSGNLTGDYGTSRNPYGPQGSAGPPVLSGGGRTGYEGVTNQPAIGGASPVPSSPSLLPTLGPIGAVLTGGITAIWAAEMEKERKARERAEKKRIKEQEAELLKEQEEVKALSAKLEATRKRQREGLPRVPE